MRISPLMTLFVAAVFVTGCGPGTAEMADPSPTPGSETVLPATSMPAPDGGPAVTATPSETATLAATGSPTPAPTTPMPASGSDSSAGETTGEPQLIMVHIRAKTPQVEQLRRMGLNIVKVRPIASNETPASKADFLNSEVSVEAVVPRAIVPKLIVLGFDVTEVPPP